jgi:Tfp pilus assembly protein PilF
MYLDDKQPLEAVPQLEQILARNPNHPEAMARLGQCRYVQGDHGEARRLLEAAAKSLPDDIPVLLHTARLDIEDAQPGKAEDRLRHALAIDPSDTDVRYALVTALRSQSRDPEAERELAEYERHKALLERANHLLQEEAKQSSRDPRPAAEIGGLLLQIRQDRQGLYWMDEALSRDPGYEPAHRALAEYFERKGDPERAAFHRRKLPQK